MNPDHPWCRRWRKHRSPSGLVEKHLSTLQDINVAQVCHENNRLVVTNNNALRPTIHSVGKYILSMTFVGREHG